LPSQGCSASPAGAYAGKVAIVDRGTCAFEIKAKFAEDAGAKAVIVANNAAGVITMGEDATVVATVPTLSVSQADGAVIKAGLPGVNVALAAIAGQFNGADINGYARLYAPNPVQVGSSFSHYDTSTSPNALMEPAITASLAANYTVDLTTALFQDEGWSLNPGNAMIGGCDTGVDVVQEGGVIIGANVQAQSNICAINAKNHGAYQSCMSAYKSQLSNSGLIHGNQGGKITSCAAKNK